MIAVWIPVTVVPTSSATCTIETFITELSSVIKNWAEASVSRTMPVVLAARSVAGMLASSTQSVTGLIPRPGSDSR